MLQNEENVAHTLHLVLISRFKQATEPNVNNGRCQYCYIFNFYNNFDKIQTILKAVAET